MRDLRALILLLSSLFLTGCFASTESSYKSVGDVEGAAYLKELAEGKSVVLGDVYIDDKYCGSSRVVYRAEGASVSQQIINGSLVSAGIWNDKQVVQPGRYTILGVGCGDSYAGLSGDWSDRLTGRDEIKKARAPKFSVAGGTILHLGTLRIKTIKKGTLFSEARVAVVREPSSNQAKIAARKAFGSLSDRLVFTE